MPFNKSIVNTLNSAIALIAFFIPLLSILNSKLNQLTFMTKTSTSNNSLSSTNAKKSQKKIKPVRTKNLVPKALELIPSILLQRAKKHPEKIALKVKKFARYKDITWQEYGRKVSEIVVGLLALGLEKGERVAILSTNSPEFAYFDLAILISGAITVAIYPNTTPKAIAYILNHSEARFLIVDTKERFSRVCEVIDDLEYLEKIILIESDNKIKSPKKSIKLQSFMGIIGQQGLEMDESIIEDSISKLKLDDTAIIIYTSGTTGHPKGAMLTHRNISFICSTMNNVATDIKEHETFISFLPLAHALERIGCLYFSIYNGGTIGFAEKLETVAKDILDIRPTILYGVPRFFEKIYNSVMASVEGGNWIKRRVFRWAVGVGRQVGKRKMKAHPISLVLELKYWMAEKLVFQKLKDLLGGKIKFIVSGGAPLAPAISEFFYNIGLPIMEAYGATETSAPATITRPESLRIGTVGTPIPDVEVKIAEDGEILIRGEGVCKGYYKDLETTQNTFIDGWYYSGDIGHFDDEGNLIITDRKKDIIVTSSGKNIPPQNIENVLKTSTYINQVMVYGDKRKYLTALITVNTEAIQAFASKEGIPNKDIKDLVLDRRVYHLIEQEITNKNRELASYERIKKFKILSEDFSVETGELTPTLKVKRKVVEEKYKDLLDSMYERDFADRLGE